LPQTDVPVLVLAHGMEFPDQPSGRKMRRIRDAFAKASHVIANSQFTLVQARPYLSAATQAVVINPPIGPQPDASASARAAVEAIIGSSHPVLMTLSRLEPRKGVDQVIRSLPLLIRHHPDLLYLVAGGGEDATRLKALAAECGIEPHIRFLGRVDDDMKAALFERANLFAMPVRREGASVEGFGISYCEAAWYGVPALAGQEGGAVDAVTHGVTGLVCDGADQAAVSAALLDLLGDEAQRQRFADAAKQRARGPLQWNEAIKAYLALLPRDRTEAGSAATGSGQG
jgi:phosphatidylinositol alpha-1,6-mannosyltransferase